MNRKFVIPLVVILGIGAVYFLAQRPESPARDIQEYVTVKGEPDLIRLTNPQEGGTVGSPLVVTGEARGFWFFEADFPVILTNWDGLIIAEAVAQAQGDWMTEDYVSFQATLEFEDPSFPGADEDHFSRRGYLILQKDNASGLPEFDDALEIQVWFR